MLSCLAFARCLPRQVWFEGNSQWSSVNGRSVQLSATPLQQISDIEFHQLQKISLQKLQAIDIGHVVIPKDPALKRPKKGGSILRSRQKNTNLIDTLKLKEASKDGKDALSGLMFGIPLEKCISHDEQLRKYRSSRMRERRESLDLAHSNAVRPKPRQLKNAPKGVNFTPNADKTSLLDALSLSTAGSVTHRRERRKSLNPREPQVPQVVMSCIRHLEKYAMRTVGIFRVGGSKKRTRQLREAYDSGTEIWLNETHSVHDVGALLKEFFRDIPEPLLTRDLYTVFVAAGRVSDQEKQLQILQWLVYLLPTANRDTLFALLKFLRKVADNAEDIINENGEEVIGNKMDVQNLGTLFGPNILRKTKAGQELHGEAMEQREESREVIATVSLLVDHHEDIFMVPASLLDEVLNHILETEPDALDYLLNRKASCITSKESTDLESTSTGSLNEDNELSTSLASSTELDPFQTRFPSQGRSSSNNLTSKIVEDPEELSYAGPYPIFKSSDNANHCSKCHDDQQSSLAGSERKFKVSPQLNTRGLNRGCSSPELGMRNHNNNVFVESLITRDRQNSVTLSPRTSRRIKYAEIQSGNSGCPNMQTSPAQRSPSMQRRYVGNIAQTVQNDQFLVPSRKTAVGSKDHSPGCQMKSPKLVRRSATAAFAEQKQKDENTNSPVWVPKKRTVESLPEDNRQTEHPVNNTPSLSSYASVDSEIWFTPPISPLDLTKQRDNTIRNDRLSSGSYSPIEFDTDEEKIKKKKEEIQWKQWEKMAAENRGDLLGQETLV
ncbi:rho GTPase-activating protein 6-like isoform X2 [Anneissia japonica]|uniref:rho GTPase-activating protein 6-like isoform X2 n=1 Tax=Anneissia japonica TaxID=1529436 RepID=UPI001425649C|nr:rho GTPase-activating protein 6-like isoform X2 [Anneissia japonica]